MTDKQQQIDVQFWVSSMDTNYIYLLQGKNRIIPLAWEFSCANEHDSQKIELLYRAWIYGVEILIADTGYDNEKWFKAAQELEIKFVAGVNKRNMKNKDNVRSEFRAENMKYLETEEGKKVYRKRTMIEKLFSKLKGEYKLENLRLRGFRTYERHVQWILITYLFREFVRKLEKRKFTLAYVWNQSCQSCTYFYGKNIHSTNSNKVISNVKNKNYLSQQ